MDFYATLDEVIDLLRIRGRAVARIQHAKSWELRAATSRARAWLASGRPGDARDLLAPVHDWLREGFDTADLIDSKALLAQMS